MMLTGNGSQSQSVSSGDSSQSVYGDNLTTAARKVHVQGFTLDLIITFSFFVKQSKTTEFSRRTSSDGNLYIVQKFSKPLKVTIV